MAVPAKHLIAVARATLLDDVTIQVSHVPEDAPLYTKVLPVMREAASESLERLISGTVRTTLAQPEPEHLM